MIPVLITSIMNRPDLLDRMLDSVDVHVERGLVVDNGYTGYRREFPHGEWRVWQPPFHSLGWPGTLNFGVMQTPDAPWWLFVNNDAWFDPGKLKLLCETMDASIGTAVIHHHEWTVTGVTREVIQRVGLFDEWSFWPLYFDDTDYAWRCLRAGVEVINGEWCHEDAGETLADRLQHAATVKSDPSLASANNRTWAINEEALLRKWGGRHAPKFETPWDSGLPVWAVRPDLDGRVARRW